MDRTQSQHSVMVFDPNKDPSVASMLVEEQCFDPKVTAVKSLGRLGLAKGRDGGTYCIDDEGCGPGGPIDHPGVDIRFYRGRGEEFEATPFATAWYSLGECLACATGEHVRLDEFIGRGRRKDENFLKWEEALS